MAASALAADLEREAIAEPQARPAPRLFEPRGRTLEDLIAGAWEDLVAEGAADCPVCGGTMRVVSGCDSCGADLS